MPACFWAATSTLHLKPSLWLPSLSTPNRCILYTNRPEGRLFHAIRYGHSPAWSGRYTNGRHYWEPTLTTNSSSRHRYTFPLCAATTHAPSHVKTRCLLTFQLRVETLKSPAVDMEDVLSRGRRMRALPRGWGTLPPPRLGGRGWALPPARRTRPRHLDFFYFLFGKEEEESERSLSLKIVLETIK